MVVVRNRLSSIGAGGPRQFTEIRNKILVLTEPGEEDIVDNKLQEIKLSNRKLNNTPVLVSEPQDKIEGVIESLAEQTADVKQAVGQIRQARRRGDDIVEPTTETIRATAGVIQEIENISNVRSASFAQTFVDYGPANLRLDIEELRDITSDDEEQYTLGDIYDEMGLPDVWEDEKGEQSIVAVFDTGFAEGLIDEGRIVAKYHADDVDSVYEPSEGHGTMTAGAAAAKKNDEVPFNGAAPESDVILVRITGPDGQIRSDLIADAWDWLAGVSETRDRPIVSNHSYGTPLCSSVQRPETCDSPLGEVINTVNSDSNMTAVMAAGNEAMYCGHRLSGITNGITGHNSLESVITVGALLTNGRDAQRYSSHGRGDCAPRADPKPNVSYRLPEKTYYGVEDGWKVKDMSTGLFGSGGGTSHASPSIAGLLALVQSKKYKKDGEAYQTEELKRIIKKHSSPPRATQINQFGFFAGPGGWDARFGYGEFDVKSALEEI